MSCAPSLLSPPPAPPTATDALLSTLSRPMAMVAGAAAMMFVGSVAITENYQPTIKAEARTSLAPAMVAISRINYLIHSHKLLKKTLPSGPALASAYQFIFRLQAEALPIPTPRLADDGEILLLGRKNGWYLDLGFQEDGSISIYAETGSGQKIVADDLRPDAPLPPRLAAVISQIS